MNHISITLLALAVVLLGASSLLKSERISRLEGRIRHLESSAHQHQP